MGDTRKKEIGMREVHAARAFFFIGGFGTATWAPLVPLLRERLMVEDDVLGMLLLCIGVGSLLTMPLSGALAMRLGCRRVVMTASILFAAILLLVSCVDALSLAVPIVLIFGAVMGCIDVVVNIVAVLVEKGIGRRIMSGMHAFWSLGGFVGAGLYGVWVGLLGLTPFQSTAIAAGLILLLTAVYGRHLIPYGGGGGALLALPRGIIVFVGMTAFIAFLSEGAVMDWGGVYLTTVRGMDLALAGTGYSVFSAAMLTMRFLGDRVVQRIGALLVAVGGALLAFGGILLVMFAPVDALLYVGFFAIGIGQCGGLRRQHHGVPRHSCGTCRHRIRLLTHNAADGICHARRTQHPAGSDRVLCIQTHQINGYKKTPFRRKWRFSILTVPAR